MNSSLAFGTVCSLLIATVSVAFAVFSHRRQVNASVYLDLSRQLHELYKRMPKSSSSGLYMPDAEATEALVFDSLQLIRSAYTCSGRGLSDGPHWPPIGASGLEIL